MAATTIKLSYEQVLDAVQYCKENRGAENGVYAMLRSGDIPVEDLSFTAEYHRETLLIRVSFGKSLIRVESRKEAAPMWGMFQEFILEDGVPVTPAPKMWTRLLATALMVEHQKLHPPVVKGRHRQGEPVRAASSARKPGTAPAPAPYRAPVKREYDDGAPRPVRSYERTTEEWNRSGYYRWVWVGSKKDGTRHRERRFIRATRCRARKKEEG